MSIKVPDLNDEQGQALVRLARRTLAARLVGKDPDLDAGQKGELLSDPALQRSSGTFVTLKIGGQLRGCIGSLVGREPIVEGVRHHAVQAAFHDPRFKPLDRTELDEVDIEISVLTEPQPLSYIDTDDLLAKIRPHVDGVTIRKGFAQATFLPQVWDQLPHPEAFLSHLCMKAGLSADAWRRGDLQVETYQVQSFEEHTEEGR